MVGESLFNGFWLFGYYIMHVSRASSHRPLFVSFSLSLKTKTSLLIDKNSKCYLYIYIIYSPFCHFISSKSSKKTEEKKEMQNYSKASSEEDYLDSETKDVKHFDHSLQELRDLRSQLHYAADYCESTFLNAKEKKPVVENTKEYICRAVVTVVDHLGCVSTNLNCLVSETNAFSDAELRINCLKQRLLSCEQYAHKLALSRVRWSENRPRLHPRYLSAIRDVDQKSNESLRDSGNPTSTNSNDEKHEIEREQDDNMPFFLYAFANKPAELSKGEANSALVLPVRDGFSSVLSKCPNPTFHFQETRKNGRSRKSVQGSDILALIRRTKRTS